MILKIDAHIHSKHSYDGCMTLMQILDTAKAGGLDAVAVCDHGRVLTDEIPQHEVKLIRGAEFSTEYGHLIGLFLTSPIEKSDFRTLCEEIHKQGGIAVLAHPFQHKKYADMLTQAVPYIDGVEVWNSRADRKNRQANSMALEFAKKHKLLYFAGSDAHTEEEIGNAYFTVEYDGDLKAAVKAGASRVWGRRSCALATARSQLVKLKGSQKKNYFKWFVFYVKCFIEDKVLYRKDRSEYVTYCKDR